MAEKEKRERQQSEAERQRGREAAEPGGGRKEDWLNSHQTSIGQ